MRVITGSARGRKLKTPETYDIRPTTDNVKEAVFNIIQFDIEGRRVLDLFAGTGQLGIEALSRGAAEAVFVDRDREAVRIVRDNLKTCGLQAAVRQEDALSALRREELIAHFKSVRAIREASFEELCAVVPKNTAQAVWAYFRGDKEEQEE